MNEIMLKVTTNVLKQANREGKWNQAQIAIVAPKFEATARDRKEILLAGVVKLVVGDNHAIWYSHNTSSETQKKDFRKLFALLANHPDEVFKFPYDYL